MNIEILGTESLGVRGLCCFVKTKNRKILIDPGIALGYTRYGLLPHPLQVAVDERIQKKIKKAWSEATDIVISHFHGDHTPLADANPYQLHIKRITGLNPKVRIWTKDANYLAPVEKKRAEYLSLILNQELIPSEGKSQGVLTFSKPVPHGEANGNLVTVMMTKIEEDGTFVHASDIQLLNSEAISQILSWKPDILLAGGPPLYLYKLSGNQIRRAWNNAKRLSQKVDTLILDHHLMRSYKGLGWLKRLSSETGKKVICGADFMKKPRMLLEARRQRLYKDMPVPEGWHEAYAKGKVTPVDYWNLGKKLYESVKLID
jgi:predicted metallo-beta-lactamase superfamily hydrolase